MTELEKELHNRIGRIIGSLAAEIPCGSLADAKIVLSDLEYHAKKLKELIAEAEKEAEA